MRFRFLIRLLCLAICLLLLPGCGAFSQGKKNPNIPLYGGPAERDEVLPPMMYLHVWTGGDGSHLLTYQGETMTAWLSPASALSDTAYPGERPLRFALASDLPGASAVRFQIEFSVGRRNDLRYTLSDETFSLGDWESSKLGSVDAYAEALVFDVSFADALATCRSEGETREEKQRIQDFRDYFRYRTVPVYDFGSDYPDEYSAATCESLSMTVFVTMSADMGTRGIYRATAELELTYLSAFTQPGSDALSWEGVQPFDRYTVTYTAYEHTVIQVS